MRRRGRTSTIGSPGTIRPKRWTIRLSCSGQRRRASASIARELALGHAGIVLERHGEHRLAAMLVAHQADEGGDPADVGAAAREPASSAATSNGSGWTRIISAAGDRREERHLVAGAHGASSGTYSWLTAQRTTPGLASASAKPGWRSPSQTHERRDRRDLGRRLDLLLGQPVRCFSQAK